jgi:hypothetical protein
MRLFLLGYSKLLDEFPIIHLHLIDEFAGLLRVHIIEHEAEGLEHLLKTLPLEMH